MKLIIQIPCFNEENTLPLVLNNIPRVIPGISSIEVLVIDDGSTDKTAFVADQLGVNHIIQNKTNLGLAKTFAKGIKYCLDANADIIVNTDGDNQYFGGDIKLLVDSILNDNADIAIGQRPILDNPNFSFFKKHLQVIGSFVVGTILNIKISDVTSGFRAYNVRAARAINLIGKFSHTLETLVILSARKDIKITTVPINVNCNTRPSRLFKSNLSYIYFSMKQFFSSLVYHRLKYVKYSTNSSQESVKPQ